MSSYYSGVRNSVPPQQGTRFVGSSYDANNSQSTASSYASSKSTTGRVPTQYSDYRSSKPADQCYINSIGSQGQKLGGGGAKSSKGLTTNKYPPLKG
uniref:Uncharacterized protein n=1 Tax=Oryza brachyantha TaxID=4533 RepID=J3MSF2_ORYBR